MEALRKRFRRQYWVLFHLRKAGFTNKELAKVYRTILLPIVDYCAAVYHPMLNDEQDQIIERLQSQALKCIYGPYINVVSCTDCSLYTPLLLASHARART